MGRVRVRVRVRIRVRRLLWYRKTLTRRWKAACCMLKSEWILRLPPG